MIYESRRELARPLFADFDSSVHGIVAQPFLLKAEVEGKVREHIPDYTPATPDPSTAIAGTTARFALLPKCLAENGGRRPLS